MPAGDLLDLAESRVLAIRTNDPAVVHELVLQTLEGMNKICSEDTKLNMMKAPMPNFEFKVEDIVRAA